jgi:Competence protein CoiA-like family
VKEKKAVPFGLKDGRLFEPLQVKRGLSCNCFCPGCGGALISKHAPSGKVAPYFSHASNSACNTALESALHLAAKQLIEDEHKLYLPELVARVRSKDPSFEHFLRSETVQRGALARLAHVRVEESAGCIRPDLIVNTRAQEVLVEIAYTSFVTTEKLAQIVALGSAAIEIDVSDLTVFSFETLAKRLFEPTPRSTWLFHPDLAATEAALRKLLDADLAREVSEREEKNNETLARIKAQEDKVLFERTLKVIKAAQAAAPFRALSNEQKLAKSFVRLGPGGLIRTLLPIKVRWGFAIAAPPLVWQASVFADLIHPALRRGVSTLCSEQVQTWLRDRFKVEPTSNGSAIPVWDFLLGLAERQILQWLKDQHFLVMVPDIAGALEVAADIKDGHVRAQCWSEKWPSPQKAKAVANGFATVYGKEAGWERVAGLLSNVRELETPIDTLLYYGRDDQGSLRPPMLRRFFLSAGFTKLLS